MKILAIDIETGISEDAEQFKPVFTPPKLTLKGEPYANSLTIAEQEGKWRSECALKAHTGQVLAVGYQTDGVLTTEYWHSYQVDGELEVDVLSSFWESYEYYSEMGFSVIGHYLKSFDLPFLYKRSLKYGIKPLWHPVKDRYNEQIIDTAELWSAGSYPKEYISLDTLAKFFGVGEKNGKGADFAKLFNDPATQSQALEYLENDLNLTFKVAERMLK